MYFLMVLYVVAFGEIFVRLFAPVPIIPRYVTGSPHGIRVGMPDIEFPQTTPETSVNVRTNSHGIRADREYAYAKPPGMCRIAILGDSIMVGYEVNIEDSFAYLLERRLREEGYKCEVINLAVSGFGTAEMLIMLQKEALKYQPDVVLFSSHMTDLDDNVRSALYAIDRNGELVRKNPSYLPGIGLSDALSRFALYRWIVENSQFYSAFRERLAFHAKTLLLNFKKRKNPGAAEADTHNATPSEDEALRNSERLNRRLLEEAKRVSEAGGSHFCVLEIPHSESRTKFVRMLPEYDEKTTAALHVFSPVEAFRVAADPSRKLFYEKGHGHLTPEGNELLAGYFFSKLQSTGWLHR